MNEREIKTFLGWFIILSQIFLIGLTFYLEALSPAKLEASERSAALSAILPATGAYFGAAVIHLLMGRTANTPSADSSGAGSPKLDASAVVITFLLPGLLAVAAAITLVLCAYGKLHKATFADYLAYLQTAQAFVCTSIYLFYFSKEVQQYRNLTEQNKSTGP
jgi:hypothetical protein